MLLLCWFDHFLDSRAEICQIFRCFLENLWHSRHSEINWPSLQRPLLMKLPLTVWRLLMLNLEPKLKLHGLPQVGSTGHHVRSGSVFFLKMFFKNFSSIFFFRFSGVHYCTCGRRGRSNFQNCCAWYVIQQWRHNHTCPQRPRGCPWGCPCPVKSWKWICITSPTD